MPAPPKGKPATNPSDRTSDRTSAVVAGGLSLLAVLGVATVFWGPLGALISPASAEPETASPSAVSAEVEVDAGVRTSLGRSDGGAHS